MNILFTFRAFADIPDVELSGFEETDTLDTIKWRVVEHLDEKHSVAVAFDRVVLKVDRNKYGSGDWLRFPGPGEVRVMIGKHPLRVSMEARDMLDLEREIKKSHARKDTTRAMLYEARQLINEMRHDETLENTWPGIQRFRVDCPYVYSGVYEYDGIYLGSHTAIYKLVNVSGQRWYVIKPKIPIEDENWYFASCRMLPRDCFFATSLFAHSTKKIDCGRGRMVHDIEQIPTSWRGQEFKLEIFSGSASHRKPKAEMREISGPRDNILMCITCRDEARSCVFIPCAHFVQCDSCAQRVRGTVNTCPLCGQEIESIVNGLRKT